MVAPVLHSGKSDVGLKRSHNEDRFLADPELGLYVVCDGMGGGNAGEVASMMAIETIYAHLLAGAQESASLSDRDVNVSPTTHRLADAVRAANLAIHRASWTHPAYAGMGTTVVAVLLMDGLLSIAHVGDSRLYLVRHAHIQALTADHSWVAEQVQRGLLTEQEAERSPKRNIVTRALGVEPHVEVEIGEIPVRRGDRFLLCSDGLTRGVPVQDIHRAIEESSDPNAMTDRLLAMANQAGGEDNTTVLLLVVQKEPSHRFWHRFTNYWLPKAS
ncbi:MAG TPA: Stp1/IreP family PP2C-type Ser/Thr phosphatase [Nitrospira sp.]|nr:Stp1/IreP family PP2C-type Ser/Thr phosphatase [Nitrospira sp.]